MQSLRPFALRRQTTKCLIPGEAGTQPFAKISQVTIKTLRYYAELGLLPPIGVDPEIGYRFYSVEQLPRLNRILALKDLGFSLKQISKLVE